MQYRRAFVHNSYIFITFVTNKRRKILTKNIEILRQAFLISKKKFLYEIFAIVVMPDHIHMIIKPDNINEYPSIIRCVKTFFTKNIDVDKIYNYELICSRQKRNEKDVWQRRYWEHTILNEDDLYKHLDYIFYNPVKHGYVENVRDWKYSSFLKFVEKNIYDINWGTSFPDRIKNLNLE